MRGKPGQVGVQIDPANVRRAWSTARFLLGQGIAPAGAQHCTDIRWALVLLLNRSVILIYGDAKLPRQHGKFMSHPPIGRSVTRKFLSRGWGVDQLERVAEELAELRVSTTCWRKIPRNNV